MQACRGREYDPGVETIETDSADEKQSVQISEIPERDFLCSYSTAPGNSAEITPFHIAQLPYPGL